VNANKRSLGKQRDGIICKCKCNLENGVKRSWLVALFTKGLKTYFEEKGVKRAAYYLADEVLGYLTCVKMCQKLAADLTTPALLSSI
jgi:hypothetical protein